jgi:hypothetical protein
MEGDVAKWPSLKAPPKGQSVEAFAEVVKCVPAYLVWRGLFAAPAPAPPAPAPAPAPAAPAAQVKEKGTYVMSGFRDAAISTRLAAAGWKMAEKVSRSTSFLLIPDDAKETVKVKAARDAGIRIVTRSQVDGVF